MRQLPSLNTLRVFEEVARHRSFSQAAIGLNVTQGAVSRQIKQLEDYLGVALFVRTPQGLSLTEAGSNLSRIWLKPSITSNAPCKRHVCPICASA